MLNVAPPQVDVARHTIPEMSSMPYVRSTSTAFALPLLSLLAACGMLGGSGTPEDAVRRTIQAIEAQDVESYKKLTELGDKLNGLSGKDKTTLEGKIVLSLSGLSREISEKGGIKNLDIQCQASGTGADVSNCAVKTSFFNGTTEDKTIVVAKKNGAWKVQGV